MERVSEEPGRKLPEGHYRCRKASTQPCTVTTLIYPGMHGDNEAVWILFLDSAMHEAAPQAQEESAALPFRARLRDKAVPCTAGHTPARTGTSRAGTGVRLRHSLGSEPGALKLKLTFAERQVRKRRVILRVGLEKWLFLLNHVNTSGRRKLVQTLVSKSGASTLGRQEGSTGVQGEGLQ